MPERDARPRDFWRRWHSRRFVVVDESMRPTLVPGDRLLVDRRALRGRPPRVGELVVLSDPEAPRRRLVKRVAAVDEAAGAVSVHGDDPGRSRDSRSFGPVPIPTLVGVVWFRYLPVERRGSIPPLPEHEGVSRSKAPVPAGRNP